MDWITLKLKVMDRYMEANNRINELLNINSTKKNTMKKITPQIEKAFNHVLSYHPAMTKMKLNIVDGFNDAIDTKILKDALDSLYNDYDKDTITLTKVVKIIIN